VRYNYLDLGKDAKNPAVVAAPVPMLASFALQYKYPGLLLGDVEKTGYASQHASYMLKANSDTLVYQMPAPDRSKMMKGVGELFARSRVEDNVHGGLGEKEMFRRMAQWGSDHCRYALAFDADWDLPLVDFHGGPVSDNERLWKRLDELVANCNQAGMQMMLCSFPEIRSRDWKAHPERQRTIFEFWRRIAQRYADLPDWAISYDFFNEPAYMNTDHCNAIMKELTAIVRSVDKRHMIVWEPGDGWAQPQWCSWMEPVKDSNVLYSFHHYGKHWGYAYDEYYPGYQATFERTQADVWLEAILFGIKHHVPIHCGEFGLSMLQPDGDGQAWLNDYLAFFERFCIGWNWWNYSGGDIYRTGLAKGDRISPYVPTLRKWTTMSGWGVNKRTAGK
jgi:aryl-phospho-beta-D-glucosidase BglC (GH1 family)